MHRRCAIVAAAMVLTQIWATDAEASTTADTFGAIPHTCPSGPPFVTTPISSRTWAIRLFSRVFHTSGCYFLEARWPRGKWRVVFAAGR